MHDDSDVVLLLYRNRVSILVSVCILEVELAGQEGENSLMLIKCSMPKAMICLTMLTKNDQVEHINKN